MCQIFKNLETENVALNSTSSPWTQSIFSGFKSRWAIPVTKRKCENDVSQMIWPKRLLLLLKSTAQINLLIGQKSQIATGNICYVKFFFFQCFHDLFSLLNITANIKYLVFWRNLEHSAIFPKNQKQNFWYYAIKALKRPNIYLQWTENNSSSISHVHRELWNTFVMKKLYSSCNIFQNKASLTFCELFLFLNMIKQWTCKQKPKQFLLVTTLNYIIFHFSLWSHQKLNLSQAKCFYII